MVKHVVKGEKWACSTLEGGKNKPVLFVAKKRDFARICEEIKEKRGFVMNPRFGLSDKLTNLVLRRKVSIIHNLAERKTGKCVPHLRSSSS